MDIGDPSRATVTAGVPRPPVRDLVFSHEHERMGQSGWRPPGTDVPSVPVPVTAPLTLAPDDPTAMPADPLADHSAGDQHRPALLGSRRNQLILLGSVAAAILVATAIGSTSARQQSVDPYSQEQTQLSTDQGTDAVTEEPVDAPVATAQVDESSGALSDSESYQLIVESWDTLAELNNSYGPPKADNTVPDHGWLRDNFGPMITGDPSARSQLSDEATEYAERFQAAEQQLESAEVSPRFTADKERLAAVYAISVSRADAYRQIATYAVDHDITEWRALQTQLGTKQMRDRLLDALSAYSPPAEP